MSPEQAQGRTKNIDHRSDVFSFGGILFEAITGRKAFEGKDAVDSLNKMIRQPVTPISELNPSAPADLQRIVRRCLAKDADERYQTIKDVAIELKEVRAALAAGAAIDTTVPPSITEHAIPVTDSGVAVPSLASRSSSAEYLFSGIKQHKTATLVIGIAVLVFVAGLIAGGLAYYHARNTEVAVESIAVLPLVNQDKNPDVDYLVDGLTESIINSLAQLPRLKVIPRSSAFRYKGKEIDPLKAGNELGVRAVLTGRVTLRGDALWVSAELIDVRDNKQLWGDQYQRKISELLAIQSDLARDIAAKLRPTIAGTNAAPQTKPHTQNSEAYQLYLKGRYFWLKFTPEDHKKAAEYFNQALAIDPTFALAYGGLGDVYGASATNGWISPREGYPKAKIAVKHALELDDTLAEAHTTSGAITMFYDLNWAAAEREYKRAIELNPNYEISYEVYTYLLSAIGKLDEGITMAQRGLQVDPLSVALSNDVGGAFYLARRYDEAIRQYQKSIELDPEDYGAHINLGEAYELKEMHEQAIKEFQKTIVIGGRTSSVLAMLGHAYARSGRQDEARKILAELNDMSKHAYVSPYDIAILYVGLGDKEHAFNELNQAYEDRAGWIINLNVEPIFDPLRSDPRFAELVRRMKFPT